MKSIITDLAKEQIRQIAKYILKEFGKDRRDEFMKDVRQTRYLIEGSPNIGPIEPLLADRVIMYRSYVMNHEAMDELEKEFAEEDRKLAMT